MSVQLLGWLLLAGVVASVSALVYLAISHFSHKPTAEELQQAAIEKELSDIESQLQSLEYKARFQRFTSDENQAYAMLIARRKTLTRRPVAIGSRTAVSLAR